MSPQPIERRSPGHKKKTFTKEQIARMFKAREDGVTDADIARRFGVSPAKIVQLIGRRLVLE